jgi:hypothetical protein
MTINAVPVMMYVDGWVHWDWTNHSYAEIFLLLILLMIIGLLGMERINGSHNANIIYKIGWYRVVLRN